MDLRTPLALIVSLSFGVACGARTQVADVADGGGDLAATPTPAAVAPWDGGVLPPTPGAIRCGAETCAAGSDECCLQTQTGQASNGCGSRAEATCNGTQATRRCDETADCDPGEVCCFSNVASPPVTLGSYCIAADQKCGGAVGCGDDADCDALGLPACVARLCRGDVLQTCGRLASSLCDP